MMMEANSKKTIIRNVAFVDLRTASDAAIRSIERLENVAAVLYSPQNAEQVARIPMHNVASVMESPGDAQLITGQTEWRKQFFAEIERPLNVIAAGQLMLGPDVQAEDIRNGIDKLIVMGQLMYPDHVGGAIQSKLEHMSGQTIPYAGDSRLTVGKLRLTQSYLEALDDGAKLTIIGSVDARTVLPNELIEHRLGELRIVGALTCREENADVLLSRLGDGAGDVHVTVIPAGFEPISGTLALDAALLDALPVRKLHCRELRIAPDVSAEALDGAVDALQVTRLLVAPAALRSVLARKTNLLQTDAVMYNGTLWLVDDEETLVAERFDYVEGPVTLVVDGELTIAPDVEPALLAQRVEKVHNFGEIACTPSQMAALQSRAGQGHGEYDAGAKPIDDDNVIGNTAYLKL